MHELEQRYEARQPHKMAAAQAHRQVWETPAHPRQPRQDPDLKADLFLVERRRAGAQGLRHNGSICVCSAKGRRRWRNSCVPAALGFGSAAQVGEEPWRGPGWSPVAWRERRRGFLEGRGNEGITCRRKDKPHPVLASPLRLALPCFPPTAPWSRGLSNSWREAGFPRLLRIWRIFGSGRSPFPRFNALIKQKTSHVKSEITGFEASPMMGHPEFALTLPKPARSRFPKALL